MSRSRGDIFILQNSLVLFYNSIIKFYSFRFENLDGTFRKEDGGIASNTKGMVGFVVRGVYGFIDPDGRHHSVQYVADEGGYQPKMEDGDIRYNDRRIV